MRLVIVYRRCRLHRKSFFAICLCISIYLIQLIAYYSRNINYQDELLHHETMLDMKRRKETVAEVCRRENLGAYSDPAGATPVVKHPSAPNFEAFYFDWKHGISWCPVYKAASSTWLHNFCLLGGITEMDSERRTSQWAEYTRRIWPSFDYEEGKEAFRKSNVRFFVVRHPFERILSAYRDKLEYINNDGQQKKEEYYIKYAKLIVSRYRMEGKVAETGPAVDTESQTNVYSNSTNPTFKEFVRYLIDIDLAQNADEHWIPYYLSCTPCLLNYDIIVKFETLDRDFNYLIHKASVARIINPHTWKRLTNGLKTSSMINRYFSAITSDELNRLYHKYKVDFDMFGYDIKEYELFVVK